jgi:hypothetical protein
MPTQMSAPAYAKFESGQRTVDATTLEEICRVLGLEVDEIVAEAEAGTKSDEETVPDLVLGGTGPQVPALRVRLNRLMSPEHLWLDPIRGMLHVLTSSTVDTNGDVLLEEPLMRTIAASSGKSLIECWMLLTAFIDTDDSSPS